MPIDIDKKHVVPFAAPRRSRLDPGHIDAVVGQRRQQMMQCSGIVRIRRAWLKEYLGETELVEVSSNAEGARRARDEAGTAAIAGDAAAESNKVVLSSPLDGKSSRPMTRKRVVLSGWSSIEAKSTGTP